MASTAREQIHEQLERAREHHARLSREYEELLANRDVIQEDRDSVRQLVEEAAANVQRLEAAAARIEEGTYGRCVKCGQPIAPERLEAIPDATTCVSCS
jgi:RNA polymerase-binding transcription factor DksA